MTVGRAVVLLLWCRFVTVHKPLQIFQFSQSDLEILTVGSQVAIAFDPDDSVVPNRSEQSDCVPEQGLALYIDRLSWLELFAVEHEQVEGLSPDLFRGVAKLRLAARVAKKLVKVKVCLELLLADDHVRVLRFREFPTRSLQL